MKNKNRILTRCFLPTLLGLIVFAFAGCSEDEVEYSNLSVSGDSYTFSGELPETYKIEVFSPTEWSYTIEGDWVIEVAKDAVSLTISALPSSQTGERPGKILFTAGTQTKAVTLSQLPSGERLWSRYNPIDDLKLVVMSPGGTYVGGVLTILGEDGSFKYCPVFIETATGQRTQLEPMDRSPEVTAITDDGTMFGVIEWSYSVGMKIDGTTFDVAAPAGASGTSISAVSVDGKVMVGYARMNSQYYALKWTDPTIEPAILESPELNNWREPLQNGVMARGCSADGSIVYGTEWDKLSPVHWTSDGKVHNTGDDILKKETGKVIDLGQEVEITYYSYASMTTRPNSMSPNGRYLAFDYFKSHIEDLKLVTVSYPVLFDTQTGKSIVVEECDNACGLTALNDGTLSIGSPAAGVAAGMMYHLDSQTTTLSSAWIKQKYNLIVAGDLAIIKMSVDETHVLFWRPVKTVTGPVNLFSYITPERQ